MNIQSIHTLQGLQSAVRTISEDNTAVCRGIVSNVATVDKRAVSGASVPSLGQSLGIVTLINNLQQYLESDPNIVLYPPFFPIAKYQRLDLIEKIGGVEEKIQQTSLDESLKAAFTGNPLKADATDTEISATLDKLFALRDNLAGSETALTGEIKPGLILAIEA